MNVCQIVDQSPQIVEHQDRVIDSLRVDHALKSLRYFLYSVISIYKLGYLTDRLSMISKLVIKILTDTGNL